ncbi:BrnT family toxin [Endozoicomonas gorgoniicola]|uniref:BrnT family toxin n=1 Tax=Endozoicomonas gorgoniicola TaxID=1234144 RepID=A0ABT3MQW3_9GAMM|nr:BrnT family toxin [Endozoicomonas gorgoniicola]MCW7551768.1 BrnT family toxin [Endozoicomonas gorgoniicola]
MHFEWDDAKNQANIRKHGIDFQDAVDIFNHPLLSRMDNRTDYGEERWVAIGQIRYITGVVVYTERVGDIIRIISARKATKQEARRYEEAISY